MYSYKSTQGPGKQIQRCHFFFLEQNLTPQTKRLWILVCRHRKQGPSPTWYLKHPKIMESWEGGAFSPLSLSLGATNLLMKWPAALPCMPSTFVFLAVFKMYLTDLFPVQLFISRVKVVLQPESFTPVSKSPQACMTPSSSSSTKPH